jgi:hypothetical protein
VTLLRGALRYSRAFSDMIAASPPDGLPQLNEGILLLHQSNSETPVGFFFTFPSSRLTLFFLEIASDGEKAV